MDLVIQRSVAAQCARSSTTPSATTSTACTSTTTSIRFRPPTRRASVWFSRRRDVRALSQGRRHALKTTGAATTSTSSSDAVQGRYTQAKRWVGRWASVYPFGIGVRKSRADHGAHSYVRHLRRLAENGSATGWPMTSAPQQLYWPIAPPQQSFPVLYGYRGGFSQNLKGGTSGPGSLRCPPRRNRGQRCRGAGDRVPSIRHAPHPRGTAPGTSTTTCRRS